MEKEAFQKMGFQFLEGGIHFYPDLGVDRRVTFEEVLGFIVKYRIVNFPLPRVKEICENGVDAPELVAADIKEYSLIKNDYVKVSISKDKITAYLDVSFPSVNVGDEIEKEDIIYKLYEAGVVSNVDFDKIDNIIQNKIFLEREIIAEGIPPIFGQEAQIVYEVDTEENTNPLIKEDGSVDFRSLSLLKTVEKDQLLAVKIPATKGSDGITVTGEIIDSSGDDKDLPLGKNSYISDDELSLYAKVSGRIVRNKNRLDIENILTVNGDVDFSTGNIEFFGDVAVQGDILTGFKVQTDGDIRVKGVVEGAEVISLKGNIVITRGVVGQEKARLIAKNDIRADFINEAYVEAGHDVEVGEYIMNSIVNAQNEIRAVEGRGSIIGGKAYAEKTIEAKVIGSVQNISTEVRIGGKIDKEIYEKILLIERDEEHLNKAYNQIRKEIEFIEVLKKKLVKFPEAKLKEQKELLLKLKKVEEAKTKLLEKKEALGQDFKSSIKEDEKRVTALTLHRGVLIGIDNTRFRAEFTYRKARVTVKEGELQVNFKSRYI